MARILWQQYWYRFVTEDSEWSFTSHTTHIDTTEDTTQLIPYQHPSYTSSPKFLLPTLVASISNLFTPEQSDICIDTLIRCLALSKFVYASDSLQVASLHLSLACVYLELKQSPFQAIKHCQNVTFLIDFGKLSSEETSNFPAVLLYIKTNIVLAKSLLLQQKPSEAINLLKQTVSHSQLLQTLNPNYRDTSHLVFIHYIKGHTHKLMLRYKLALSEFKICLDLVANIFGAKEEHMVWPMIEIVEVLIELSLFDNALGYADRCYEICRENEVLKPDVSLCLAKLHFAAKTKNSYANSAQYYDEWASTVDIETAGNSNLTFSRLVANFEQYILVLSKTGNQQKTYQILNQLITIYTDKHGEMCSEVGNLNRQLGLCYLTEGNIRMGVGYLERSHTCYEFSLGKHNKESKNVDQILSRVDPTHKYQTIHTERQQESKIRFKTIV